MDTEDSVDILPDSSFVEEKKLLNINLEKIDEIIYKKQSSMDYNSREIENIPSNDYEYANYKSKLLAKNAEYSISIKEYSNIRKTPYFGRMNIMSDRDKIDMYIGEKAFSDIMNNKIVYDWRAPVASLFYQNQEKYNYNSYEYILCLKRKLSVENSILTKCYDVYKRGSNNKKIIDEFLQRALENKKDNDNFVDIIKTIQEKQNEIIRDDLNKNIIVQGVAGSGKTVIILHRLSYILFNNPNINPKSFLFIAPTNIFKNKLNALNKKLQIDKISICTLSEYYKEKLEKLFKSEEKKKNDIKYIPWVTKVINDSYLDNEYFINKYSEEYYKEVIDYFNCKIQEKINGFRLICTIEKNQGKKEMFSYIAYIKTCLEEKVEAGVQECEKQLIFIIDKFQESLIEQLAYSDNIADHINEKVTNLKLDSIASLIRDELNKKITNIYSEMKDLDFYDLKQKELKNQMLEIYEEINKIVRSLNTKEVFFKEKYERNNFTETIERIYNYINNQKAELSDEIHNIESDILKKNNSILKRFYKVSIANLNSKKNKEENIKKNLEENLEKITKISEAYNIKELFELDSLYNNKLQKRNNILNLQKSLASLNELLKYVREYNGFLEIDQAIQKIYECYVIIYLSMSNDISAKNIDLSSLCEQIKEKASSIFIIKKEVIYDLEGILQPEYVWNLYREYLKDNDKIALENYYSGSTKEISRVDAYLLLRISNELGYLNRKNYNYIYLDEAQDYNDSEIKAIYLIEGKPKLNIYGDINQKIFDNVHERENWESLINTVPVRFNQYILNENYRNSIEIVNFCNKKLGLNMNAVGVSVSKVSEYDFKSIENIIITARENNSIVITNNPDILKRLNEKNIKCCNVFQSKGLEFTDVIVISEKLNKNQKYVAYTRSLKNLIIYNKM